MTYNEIINSVNYGILRNNSPEDLRDMCRIYAEQECRRLHEIGKVTASIVDFCNKTYQLNPRGFVGYIENRATKKHFVAAWTADQEDT